MGKQQGTNKTCVTGQIICLNACRLFQGCMCVVMHVAPFGLDFWKGHTFRWFSPHAVSNFVMRNWTKDFVNI